MLSCYCLSPVYLETHRVGTKILQETEIAQLSLSSQREREKNLIVLLQFHCLFLPLDLKGLKGGEKKLWALLLMFIGFLQR